MKRPVLHTRKDVVSAIICTYPGGRAAAAESLGMCLKKFDNHAYENPGSRPLTDEQLFKLEQQAGTAFLPRYIATRYDGLFVPLAAPETLDNVDLFNRTVKTAASRGCVDLMIAQALDDGVIRQTEANAIAAALNLSLSARYAEVLATIQLYSAGAAR